MRNMQLTAAGLTICELPEGCLAIDITFADRRIWTVEIAEVETASGGLLPWPDAVLPHLRGTTAAAATDSATGEVLWQGDLQFSDDQTTTTVERDDGVQLSVNKWGFLAPDLASMSEEVIASLLDETQRLIDFLNERSKRPFIVGGTLLGAVRSGALLPHDDDVDIAFLSEHTHPALVGAETLGLARELRECGYEVVEHSAAHLQLVFRDEHSLRNYHIDVFAAFFTDDGHINQPFHVRGPFTVEQMLPFSEATLHGVAFPAPADVENWLVMNYDENWRTPIPGFALETPEATSRRFNNWFGGFNFKREFWDNWHVSPSGADASIWTTGQRWFERQHLESPLVIDIGCGIGQLTRAIAARHPETKIVGADFSESALSRARDLTPSDLTNISFLNANLSMLALLLLPRRVGHAAAFDVTANHVLEQMGDRARGNTLRLMRLAIRSGGSTHATAYSSFASDVSPDDPTTWHLEQEVLAQEAAQLGMIATFTDLLPAPGEASRRPYSVTFTLPQEALPPSALAQKVGSQLPFLTRLKARLSRAARPQVTELQLEISELRTELDELRHDSLRVAEILDLLENELTRGMESA